MNIIDVENMNSAELKAQRAEAVAAVTDAPELAQRYVQARLDATLRDEKLGEQGRTIKQLQDALEAVSAREIALTAERSAARASLKSAEALVADLGHMLDHEAARANRNEELAKARRLVLADLATRIAPLLAAE